MLEKSRGKILPGLVPVFRPLESAFSFEPNGENHHFGETDDRFLTTK